MSGSGAHGRPSAARTAALVIAAFLVAAIGGCTPASDPARTIGLSLGGPDQALNDAMRAGAVDRATVIGVALDIRDAGTDATRQLADIRALIGRHVAVIAIEPIDPQALMPAVREANAAQIPLVSVLGLLTGGVVAARVTSDDSAGAGIAASFLVRQLGGVGSIVAVQPRMKDSSTSRESGFRDVIGHAPGISVLDPLITDGTRTGTRAAVGAFLAAHPDLGGIFAETDAMALGAADAVTAAGLGDQIVVVGFGGEPAALASIADGGLTGTVSAQPRLLGASIADVGQAIIAHQKVDRIVSTPLELATRDNVDFFQ